MESERLYSSSGMNAEMARSVGFDWQLLEHVPEESHDRRLDGIITESQLLWPLGE